MTRDGNGTAVKFLLSLLGLILLALMGSAMNAASDARKDNKTQDVEIAVLQDHDSATTTHVDHLESKLDRVLVKLDSILHPIPERRGGR